MRHHRFGIDRIVGSLAGNLARLGLDGRGLFDKREAGSRARFACLTQQNGDFLTELRKPSGALGHIGGQFVGGAFELAHRILQRAHRTRAVGLLTIGSAACVGEIHAFRSGGN